MLFLSESSLGTTPSLIRNTFSGSFLRRVTFIYPSLVIALSRSMLHWLCNLCQEHTVADAWIRCQSITRLYEHMHPIDNLASASYWHIF